MIEAVPPLIVQKLDAANVSIEKFLGGLSVEEQSAIANSWELWGLPYQQLPEGDWRRWLFRAGRGTGKTHTGARITSEVARDRKKIRRGEIGIIARTNRDARKVMVEGPSGILACAPSDFRPVWSPGSGKLTWPNGVVGYIYSADEPNQIRGANLSWAWCDEVAMWPKLHEVWIECVEPALRIGWQRCMLTTTPKRTPDLKQIEDMTGTVVTNASTYQNPYLGRKSLEFYKETYEGTRAGRLEMLGQYLDENENALWRMADIERDRVPRDHPLDLVRVVVAIDPAVTADEKSDETGMIVAGRGSDGRAYVIADKSMKGSPMEWARMAVAQYKRWQASRIVAEVNNGGDLVETTIRVIDDTVAYKAVRASRGKFTRAEPIAAMYERGKVSHVGVFEELEQQLVTWDPTMTGSPDRLDALVWALHELFFGDDHVGPLSAYLRM